MRVFAIADLHLSFGVPNKKMDLFGPAWQDHAEQIASHWRSLVTSSDLVLIPGDISWAMTLDEVLPDLAWIDALPGTKVMIRGNHDYWWSSLKKVQSILPSSIRALHHNAITINDISICGTRFWDSPEYSFAAFYDAAPRPDLPPEDEKIYQRELQRLSMALQQLDPKAPVKIALTHYPPIGPSLAPSKASSLYEQYGISYALFGHLHIQKTKESYFGQARGVHYALTACDFLNFIPLKLEI